MSDNENIEFIRLSPDISWRTAEKINKGELNGRGYEQLSVACAMERIAYSLCYVGA